MKYNGIVTPFLTPFKRDETVDYDALKTMVDFLKEIGVSGIFPSSSTGLFPFLSLEERKKLLEKVREYSSLKIFAGIGSADTKGAIDLAKHAKDVGADAVVLMPSYYIKSDQKWIINHFESVLKAIDIDFIIYNIPQLTNSYVDIETIKYLKSQYSQISGIKDSSGDMRYFTKLMEIKDKNFSVFQGQDDLLLISLVLGADGGVCGTSNFSDLIVKLYNAYQSGDIERARSIQMDVNNLFNALSLANFPSGYYHALYHKFNIQGGYRKPMVPPEEKVARLIEKYL